MAARSASRTIVGSVDPDCYCSVQTVYQRPAVNTLTMGKDRGINVTGLSYGYGTGRLVKRAPGGQDVVNQQHGPVGDGGGPRQTKGPANVNRPL